MLPIGSRAVLAASFLSLAALALALPAQEQTAWRVLEERMFHLGNDESKDWPEAPVQPQAQPLEIRFQARANAAEWLLEVTARDVDDDWALELNGREFARLRKIDAALLTARYPVPTGFLVDGDNVLRVRALRNPDDDLTVGRVRLAERSLREVERLGRLEVLVVERGSLVPLPARLTVVAADGTKLPLYYAERPLAAVRPGIAYVADGRALLELPEGRCEVWASRGMEWSAAKEPVEVVYGETRTLKLALTREVDTTGWVAADTHIHTFTHSGHGDASVEERLVTLAGEGVELAIATDHNHQTDYRPLQQKLALSPWFTPVVGNEVTSDNGHMNAFPMDPAAPLPPHEETDWKKLVAGIRAKGAKVVILNHPRWPEDGKDPLTQFGFDERTGKNAAGQEFTFDCIEVVNSDSPTSPPRMVLPAWYALLEAGQRFTAIGSSDSHAVGVIVGQGRTYVPSATDDPARIDVDAACGQFLAGRVSVSLGMFATITIDGKGMGERVSAPSGSLEAVVTVRHPSWITPRTLELVVNGSVAATVRLDDAQASDRPTEKLRRVSLALPRTDNWIVALAEGDRVTAPFWEMSLPAALALTNPVYASR
jgi:hypothetical protein